MTWLLVLNPMRANAEHHVPVARAETREALLRFVEAETVAPYTDFDGTGHAWHGWTWHKVFRRGGPLEWFNPPSPPHYATPWYEELVDVGTAEDWMERAREQYHRLVTQVPEVP